MAMIRRWLALTYYLYALRLAALSHFYFNPLYKGCAVFGGGFVFQAEGQPENGKSPAYAGDCCFQAAFGLFFFLFVIHDGQAVY